MSTNDAVESWTVGDLTVSLHPDLEPDSPRNWDNLGTMVCWHRWHKLGDQHQYPIPESWEDLTGMIEADNGKCLFVPLYLIDHSGLAMRTRDYSDVDPGEWDSGLVGVIFVSYDKLRLEYGTKYIRKALKGKALLALESEVHAYSAYLQGDVLGFVIEDVDGEHVDSCWGYYPDQEGDGWDYIRQEATESAEWHIRERARKAGELAEAVFGYV